MQYQPTPNSALPLPTAEMLRDLPLTQAFINMISAPIVVLRIDGQVVAVNAATSTLTGYAAQDIVGHYIWEVLFSEAATDRVMAYFRDRDRVLNERDMVNRLRFKNGEDHIISWNTQVIYEDDVPVFVVGTGHDVSGLQRATSALRESEANYRRLVNNMNEGLGVQDADGIITYVNHRFAAMLGYERDAMVGMHLHDLLTDEGIRVHDEQMAQRWQGISTEYEVDLVHRDGHLLQTRVSGEAILGPDGDFQGSFGVIRDITSEKAAQQRNESTIAALESFAGTVAHDLKNPLNMVLTTAEVVNNLFHELPADDIRDYLAKISRQAKKMDAIIDELMVLASVDADQVPRQPLDITSILQEVRIRIEHYLYDYPDARIAMPQRWPLAAGHPPWVEEVFINYMTNALKYGGTPPIVRLGAETLEDGMIRFWVRDNGPGIGHAQQSSLFKPWQRLNPKLRAKGHGLGLSIVKRIVERLGGEVGVMSAPGHGTEFWFTLPPAEPEEQHGWF